MSKFRANIESKIAPEQSGIKQKMTIDSLRDCPLFKELRPEELEEIAQISRVVEIPQGRRIFRAGDAAASFYILTRGEVDLKFPLYVVNRPMELTLSTVREGEVFGWSAFVEPFKYILSAYTAKDTKIFKIRAVGIRELCKRKNHLGYVVMKNIATVISYRFVWIQGLLKHVIQGNLE